MLYHVPLDSHYIHGLKDSTKITSNLSDSNSTSNWYNNCHNQFNTSLSTACIRL